MTSLAGPKRIGFFTRLLDPADPAARYHDGLEQIRRAEALGYDAAWVAQHHADGAEGGLPSPFVFLAAAAAETTRIRLGTGIVTLALDHPLRAAEDAAVLDLLSGGRVELGLGTGGSAAAFTAFGLRGEARGEIFAHAIAAFRSGLRGEALPGGATLFPTVPSLDRRVWQATFSAAGGERAGRAGDGLMLSRTQPRPADAPGLPLAEIQVPIVEAYLAALPAGARPRIMASRSVYVADDRAAAFRFAEAGLARFAARLRATGGRATPTGSLTEVIAGSDLHLGTPDEVVASLRGDATLAHATEVAVQVHSADPPHPHVLRSLELFATEVAPALGWTADPASRLTSAAASRAATAPASAARAATARAATG